MISRLSLRVLLALSLVLVAGCQDVAKQEPTIKRLRPIVADLERALDSKEPGRWQAVLRADSEKLSQQTVTGSQELYLEQVETAVSTMLELLAARVEDAAPSNGFDAFVKVGEVRDKTLSATVEMWVLKNWPAGGGRALGEFEYYQLVSSMLLDEQQPLNKSFNALVTQRDFDTVAAGRQLEAMINLAERQRRKLLRVSPPAKLASARVTLLRALSYDLEAGRLYKEVLSGGDAEQVQAIASAAQRGWAKADRLFGEALKELSEVPGADKIDVR